MNIEIANALSIYFETLFELNQKLLIVCGKGNENFEKDKTLLDVLHDIPRMIPFSRAKEKKEVCIQNRNGLLSYRDEIKYLKPDYESIINDHQDILMKVNLVRNKAEHNMHLATVQALVWNFSHSYDFTYDLSSDISPNEDRKIVSISSDELIDLIKSLNLLFSRLQNDVKIWARQNGLTNDHYYSKISSFDFNDFNKIYDSKLFWVVGKVLAGY